MSRLEARPVTLREARAWIAEHHRHNLPPRGWRFGVAVYDGDRLCGVGVAGQPVARALDDGRTIEVTRVCTDGTRNACTLLYGRLCRASFALGYTRVITYTLASEPGTSVHAAGFVAVASTEAGRTWNMPHRPRTVEDLFGTRTTPDEAKTRWQRLASAYDRLGTTTTTTGGMTRAAVR